MRILLSQRQKDMISILLRSEPAVSGAVIAGILNVTTRTIRSEKNNINHIFGEDVIYSSNKGYQIDGYCTDKFNLENIVISEENQIQQIIRMLILEDAKFVVDELAERFFISTSTLNARLKEINAILEKYNLRVVKNNNFVFIEGTEFNKRSMISSLIYCDVNHIFYNLENTAAFFDNIDLIEIKNIVMSAMKTYNYFIDDFYGSNLIINIAIAVSRLKKGIVIDEFPDKVDIEKGQIEYKIASRIAQSISRQFDIQIDEENAQYICILILGQLKPKYLHQYMARFKNPIDEQFYSDIKKILIKTFNHYMLHIDFDEFLPNFVLHINSLIKRSSLNIMIRNELVYNIKRNCPFIYEVAVYVSDELKKKYLIKISDDEIGFIAVHIGFAIENSTKQYEKLRAVILTNGYGHTQEKLVDFFREKYADKVEVVDALTCFQNKAIEVSVDMIVSTLPNYVLDKNFVSISPLLTAKDIAKIDHHIATYYENQNKKNLRGLLLKCFQNDLFFKNIDFRNKEEAITFLGNKLVEFGIAQEGFTQSVLKREALSSTCYLDSFAIPHAMELNAYQTTFCVLINQNPIQWDDHKIKVVFMIAVSQKDRQSFMKIYDGIIEVLCNYQNLNEIIHTKNYSEFIEIFNRCI